MVNPQARDDWVNVPDPNPYAEYLAFKYRIWLTWYTMTIGFRSGPSDKRQRTKWISILGGEDTDEDLWLWEEVDEGCIKENFPKPEDLAQMPKEDWLDACRAIEARQVRATTNPWAYLLPESRIHLMVWLLTAESHPYELRRLHGMILRWGRCLAVNDHRICPAICQHCGVSHFLLPWLETVLEIYSLDDLRSVALGSQWSHCGCFLRGLYKLPSHYHSLSPKSQAQRSLNSVAYRVLYGATISPWPLLLWVTFRATVGSLRGTFQNFVDLLRRTRPQVFCWDDDVERALKSLPGFHRRSYPLLWWEYILQLDLVQWQHIHKMTWTGYQGLRAKGIEQGRIRLATFFFMCASTGPLTWPSDILAPLNITLDDPLFASIARVVGEDYKSKLSPINLHCDQFWTSSNLRQWLVDRNDSLCHAVAENRIFDLDISDIRCLDIAMNELPQYLMIIAYTVIFKFRAPQVGSGSTSSPPSYDKLEKFKSKFLGQSQYRARELLDSLETYYEDFNMLSRFVKPYKGTLGANPRFAENISEQIHCDTVALVVRLVLFLRDPSSHKRLLECRGDKAQKILDLLQDILDHDSFILVRRLLLKALLRLSRKSGLHPRCFPLLGLQKVGRQVAAGGFGDIWKGLVCGQNVSVKIMRLFREDAKEALLKEFGREAAIWRQLSHPNLLPFFGIYYLEERICLISPWMDHGNIMEYLVSANPNVERRLSLILDVAKGLEYLHTAYIVHGDLKGVNILVTPSHRACIADFGLASVVDAMTVRFTHSTASVCGGTPRYQAPELIRGEKTHLGSDIYAFACVCYEVLTGKVPFHELLRDTAVMLRVVAGGRPSQPESCSGTERLDALWDWLQLCWVGESATRPTAGQTVACLQAAPICVTGLSTQADWDNTFTSKFRRSLRLRPLSLSVAQIRRQIFGNDTGLGQDGSGHDGEKQGSDVGGKRRRQDNQELDLFGASMDEMPRVAGKRRRHDDIARRTTNLDADAEME